MSPLRDYEKKFRYPDPNHKADPKPKRNPGLPTFRTTEWNRIASFAGLGLGLGLGLIGLGLGLASQASRVYLCGAKGGETHVTLTLAVTSTDNLDNIWWQFISPQGHWSERSLVRKSQVRKVICANGM